MFKELRQLLFSSTHFVIVDEADVIPAIKTIYSNCKQVDDRGAFVRNAGWENKPDRYFISFDCYVREWKTLKKELTDNIKSIEIMK